MQFVHPHFGRLAALLASILVVGSASASDFVIQDPALAMIFPATHTALQQPIVTPAPVIDDGVGAQQSSAIATIGQAIGANELDALRGGATGGILAVGCVVPEICVEIFRAFKAGEEEKAALLQSKLTPLAAAVTTRFGIGGLKAALDLASYRGGFVRPPLRAPDEAARREIAALLEDAKAAL